MFDDREEQLEQKVRNYSKALDLVVDHDTDWHAVAMEVAKKDPELFVQAVNIAQGPKRRWFEEVSKEPNYVARIKMVREHTGLGLRESKDYVDEYFPRRED